MSARTVDEFFQKLSHPFKTEMQVVRTIICEASPKIEEGVKWGGPSFDYMEPMATINPRITAYVAIIFHKGDLLRDISALLEPAPKGKAYVRFHSMEEVLKNKTSLQKVVREWTKIMER